MKILLLVLFLASSIFTLGGEKEIGTITASLNNPPEKPDITVSYDYDGKGKLVLTVQNIQMNAAAAGVAGSIKVEKNTISIQPVEQYDSRGPVDSIKWYTLKYVIQNIKPGQYSIVHDDSKAEGGDHKVVVKLDLSAAGKGKKTVTLPDPSGDPLAE